MNVDKCLAGFMCKYPQKSQSRWRSANSRVFLPSLQSLAPLRPQHMKSEGMSHRYDYDYDYI